MGIGDELMMAGEARRMAETSGGRYLMLTKHGAPKWHWLWEGNPDIARPGQSYNGVLPYTNGLRPYQAKQEPHRHTFREYTPTPANIVIPRRAVEFARPYAGSIVFNPTIKENAPPNKDWGVERWRELVAKGDGYRWLQLGERTVHAGGERVPTPHFFDAVAVIAVARAAVVHEGALHHVAAAVGTPCIVIRGGFISPRVTGYKGQIDCYVDDPRYPLGCGMRQRCEHCAESMRSISPDDVLAALRTIAR